MSNTFKQRFAVYKQRVEADTAAYAMHIRTNKPAGNDPSLAKVDEVYLDILERGGKRLRGTLAIVGYEMCGGRDTAIIDRAATAIEMMHAYILIIDDIQDRAKLRRGKPSAHELLANYAEKELSASDAPHAGIALALNAALTGAHAAELLLAGLNVDPELKIKVLGIVNHTMLLTAHGQTSDIVNELRAEVTKQQVEQTMELKTAHYSMLNPLCVGMVLAGAGCEDTDAIREYALNTGMAFQIIDDIIGVFGEDAETGKTAMDDICEGKQTLLTVYALAHLPKSERAFLRRCIGNSKLERADFERCKQLIEQSGALEYAKTEAERYTTKALQALDAAPHSWAAAQVTFLRELATSLTQRTA